MTLAILAYGHPILQQPCQDIAPDLPGLDPLIRDMWETMVGANGCGLAAPQIGHSIRLFIVDSKTTYDSLEPEERDAYYDLGDQGIMEIFINARICNRSEGEWEDEEGCLSIPGITQNIKRSWHITIEYYNYAFEKQCRTFGGATARMIQHEYDHTEGILYLDHLSEAGRKLLEPKLKRISKGKVATGYAMKFV